MLTKKQLLRRILCYYKQMKKTNKIPKGLQKSNDKKKKVSFSNENRIILVPSRQDYKVCGLHNELWWQPTDYLHFKSEAKEEVTLLMKLNNMDVKSAINHLYQPMSCLINCSNNISYNSIPLFISNTESNATVLFNESTPMFVKRDIHSPPRPCQRKEVVHPLALMANDFCQI